MSRLCVARESRRRYSFDEVWGCAVTPAGCGSKKEESAGNAGEHLAAYRRALALTQALGSRNYAPTG